MIEDEAAIITGASSAIGKAVARLPARLAIASERNGLHAVSNDVDGGQGSMAIRATVSSRGQPPASARQTVAPGSMIGGYVDGSKKVSRRRCRTGFGADCRIAAVRDACASPDAGGRWQGGPHA
ncbi:hypothetical protein [Thauera sp. SDU_THAU2]|uniref:hypothetical protein n=1 Tax=Thauera sp. SDU_THAU2 TaxID=3136633 RepID=UPI0031203988